MSHNKIKIMQKEELLVAQERDLFQTPNYAIDLLLPFIPKHKVHTIWEPAAGERKIVHRILEKSDFDVCATDIRQDLEGVGYYNFLTGDCKTLPEIFFNGNWGGVALVTNPPFSLKRKFYNRCRTFERPFALLIPADYSGWIIKAVQEGAEKIIPTRRVDYVTPTGKSGKSSQSQFHSMWLTWGFELGRTETFVELTNKDKENI